MGVEGGIKCVKYLIFLFNFIFWITGLALVVLGILVQLALHETVSITDATASIAPIVLIVVGVVIFFIAFFGCCGAWKENYCMITTFTVLLVLIIIIEIAVAVTGYLYQDKIEAAVNESLTAMIAQYNSTDEEVTKAVDHLQENLRCCGVNNASDWEGLAPDGNTVPDSCCVNITERCGVGALSDPNKIHQQGCQAAVQELIEKNLLWIIIAAVVIAVIQILGIVFSCMLMKGIRSGYEVM